MAQKTWTADDVRELAALAKRKGVKKQELAAMIGVHAATLSSWLSEERDVELPLLSQNAISWVEYRISRMSDRAPPGRSRSG